MKFVRKLQRQMQRRRLIRRAELYERVGEYWRDVGYMDRARCSLIYAAYYRALIEELK